MVASDEKQICLSPLSSGVIGIVDDVVVTAAQKVPGLHSLCPGSITSPPSRVAADHSHIWGSLGRET